MSTEPEPKLPPPRVSVLKKHGIVPPKGQTAPARQQAPGAPPERIFDVPEGSSLDVAAHSIEKAIAAPSRAAHQAGRPTTKQVEKQAGIHADVADRHQEPTLRRLHRIGPPKCPSYSVVLPKALLGPWTEHGLCDVPGNVKVEGIELPRHGWAIVITPADRGEVNAKAQAQRARELGEWDPQEFDDGNGKTLSCGEREIRPDILEQYRLVDLCDHGCALPCANCGCGISIRGES